MTDDRWDELVRDLAARVAVYAPEWTDTSPHDPGITLLELFAFLGESLLGRADRDPVLRARLLAEIGRLERVSVAACDDATLVRPRFFAGQLLSAVDLEQEQDYQRARHRRHARLLHGIGVVSGLDVSIEAGDKGGKAVVAVSPGLAIDRNGEELVLCERTASRLSSRATAGYVTVRLSERATGATPDGEAARIEESAVVSVTKDVAPGSLPIASLVRDHDTWRLDATFQPARTAR